MKHKDHNNIIEKIKNIKDGKEKPTKKHNTQTQSLINLIKKKNEQKQST